MKYPFKVLNKKKFVLCFINAFIVNMCIYLMPVMLAWFTKEPFTIERFKYLIISVIAIKSIEIILNHFWIIYILRFENKYGKDLQLAYFNRIVKMKPFKLNTVHNGFLKKQIDIISEESQEFMESVFETVNGFFISIVIFLIQVINQDRNLFIICLSMLVCMVLYNVWLGKKYVIVQEKYNHSYSKYNATYVDFLQNVKTVKRFNANQFANKKNQELFENVLPQLDKTNFFYSLRSNGISFFVYMMYIVVLVNLYFKMQNGENVLSYLLFYATIFEGLTGELKDLSRLFMHFNKFQAATNQVEKMIGNEPENHLIKDWKTIQISNLEFQYSKDAKTTIQIPNFEIHRGDKISIVGKSGQGKSTFLNIFSRYLEIDDNHYKIDGKSKIGNLDLAYISQEIDLFDLSVKENLCLGKDISDKTLMKILAKAGLQDWVEKLENGLDTVVGERGLKLSVGQKQRLNLIRGILLDKDIYVLDEPTSNLDKETEALIVGLIQEYLEDKTVVIVTHRDEIKRICKKHYVFEENRMREEIFCKKVVDK